VKIIGTSSHNATMNPEEARGINAVYKRIDP
jgi:hypothetical protein